jgi:hypothetical protein
MKWIYFGNKSFQYQIYSENKSLLIPPFARFTESVYPFQGEGEARQQAT